MRSIRAPRTSESKPRRPSVALACLLTLSLVALLPLTASAGSRKMSPGACGRLSRQIVHYQDRVLPMAYDRGDRLWWEAIEEQVDRLKNRRADLCPEWGAQRTAMQKLEQQAEDAQRVLAKAAKLAAMFFTGGLAGP